MSKEEDWEQLDMSYYFSNPQLQVLAEDDPTIDEWLETFSPQNESQNPHHANKEFDTCNEMPKEGVHCHFEKNLEYHEMEPNAAVRSIIAKKTAFVEYFSKAMDSRAITVLSPGTFIVDSPMEVQYIAGVQPIPNGISNVFTYVHEEWTSSIAYKYLAKEKRTVLEFTVTNIRSGLSLVQCERVTDANKRSFCGRSSRMICHCVLAQAIEALKEHLLEISPNKDALQRLRYIQEAADRKCQSAIAFFGLRNESTKIQCLSFFDALQQKEDFEALFHPLQSSLY